MFPVLWVHLLVSSTPAKQNHNLKQHLDAMLLSKFSHNIAVGVSFTLKLHTLPFLLPVIALTRDWLRPAFKYCPRGIVRLGDANMLIQLLDLSQSVCKVLHMHRRTSAVEQRFYFPSSCIEYVEILILNNAFWIWFIAVPINCEYWQYLISPVLLFTF